MSKCYAQTLTAHRRLCDFPAWVLPAVAVLALGAGLAGCSILDPVPPAAGGYRLSNAKRMNDGAATSSDAASKTATSSSDSPEDAAKKAQPTPARDCAEGKLASDCFAGGLGEAIDAMDTRRVELVNLARNVSNGNAAYNASLYPAGAVAVFEKLRGATNRNLLVPAAAAAGLYGFVNSGVVDRERHYLRAAGELHCAIVRSGAWLYLKSDTQSVPAQPPRRVWSAGWLYLEPSILGSPAPPPFLPGSAWHYVTSGPPDAADANSLDAAVSHLRQATLEFRSARVALLSKLEPVAAVAAPALDSIRQRAATAAGQARGGSAGQDQRDAIAQRTRRQLEAAQAVLESVRALQAQVRGSGLRLRAEWASIEQSFQSMLSERVPLAVAPDKVATELLTRLKAIEMAKAQGEALNLRAGADELDPLFPAALGNGVSKSTRPELQKFAAHEGVKLAQARDNAQAWLDDHALRVGRVNDEVRDLDCKEKAPPVPVRTVASQAASAASKPITDATTGKTTTTTTSTTTTPGSSPLPAAP